MEIFQYSYMIRAIIVGLAVSIIIPFMGIVVVNKKISIIGDALSHVSLSGVMLGLIMGWTPILGAILTCILASLFLEFIRSKPLTKFFLFWIILIIENISTFHLC